MSATDDSVPGFSPAPGELEHPPPRAFLRRQVQLSTLLRLVLAIPWFVASWLVLAALAELAVGLFQDPASSQYRQTTQTLTWIILVGWAVSGVVVLWPPIEDVLARALRLRRPNAEEAVKLDTAWQALSHRAGLGRAAQALWVEDSGSINARARAGHAVAVTRRAIATTPAPYLEAVLAHELAHHLGAQAVATNLAYWYSLPARLLVRASVVVARTGWAVLATIHQVVVKLVEELKSKEHGCVVEFFGFLVRLNVLWTAALLTALFLVLATPFAWIPLVLVWLNRRSEKHADRVAAQLGYGRLLLDLLSRVQLEDDAARAQLSRWKRAFSPGRTIKYRLNPLRRYLEQPGSVAQLNTGADDAWPAPVGALPPPAMSPPLSFTAKLFWVFVAIQWAIGIFFWAVVWRGIG